MYTLQTWLEDESNSGSKRLRITTFALTFDRKVWELVPVRLGRQKKSEDWNWIWYVKTFQNMGWLSICSVFLQSNSNLLNFEVREPGRERGGGRVVVTLLACGTRGPDSIPSLAAWISEIGYLLLPSHNMADIPLARRKSSITVGRGGGG